MTLEERFWPKVTKGAECWLWTAATDGHGYGQIGALRDGRWVPLKAHRVALHLAGKEVPAGMDVDHICRVRLCVNPKHLRVVTRKQNQENMGGATRRNRTSGVLGVHWSAQRGRWIATVCHNKKRHHVGTFDDLDKAAAAVRAKRNELYTHNEVDRLVTP